MKISWKDVLAVVGFVALVALLGFVSFIPVKIFKEPDAESVGCMPA